MEKKCNSVAMTYRTAAHFYKYKYLWMFRKHIGAKFFISQQGIKTHKDTP